MVENTKSKKNEEEQSIHWKSTLLNGSIQLAKAAIGAVVVGWASELGRTGFQRMVASRSSGGVSGSVTPLRKVI